MARKRLEEPRLVESFALAPTVDFTVVDDAILIATEQQALRVAPVSLSRGLKLLKNGCTRGELGDCLSSRIADQLLSQLAAHDLLVDTLANASEDTAQSKQFGYLARFSPSPNAAQEHLGARSVAILGVGGMGSVVLQHLIAAGVTRFQLIDDDTVALDNLNRQLIYEPASVGASKVAAAAQYVKRVQPGATVHAHETRITSPADLTCLDGAPVDLLVVAADQPPDLITAAVEGYCMKRSLPFVGGAVGIEMGFWGPLVVPGQTACFSCFEQALLAGESAPERQLRESADLDPPAYSFGPTNTLISAFLSRDVLHFLGGLRGCSCLGKRIWLTFSAEQLPSFAPAGCAHLASRADP